MRSRDGKEWKQKMHRFEIDNLDPKSIMHLNVPAGAGVFFTGLTIHGSFANTSPDRPSARPITPSTRQARPREAQARPGPPT